MDQPQEEEQQGRKTELLISIIRIFEVITRIQRSKDREFRRLLPNVQLPDEEHYNVDSEHYRNDDRPYIRYRMQALDYEQRVLEALEFQAVQRLEAQQEKLQELQDQQQDQQQLQQLQFQQLDLQQQQLKELHQQVKQLQQKLQRHLQPDQIFQPLSSTILQSSPFTTDQILYSPESSKDLAKERPILKYLRPRRLLTKKPVPTQQVRTKTKVVKKKLQKQKQGCAKKQAVQRLSRSNFVESNTWRGETRSSAKPKNLRFVAKKPVRGENGPQAEPIAHRLRSSRILH